MSGQSRWRTGSALETYRSCLYLPQVATTDLFLDRFNQLSNAEVEVTPLGQEQNQMNWQAEPGDVGGGPSSPTSGADSLYQLGQVPEAQARTPATAYQF